MHPVQLKALLWAFAIGIIAAVSAGDDTVGRRISPRLRFIATIREGYDPASIAQRVRVSQGSERAMWKVIVEKTHLHVRALILVGDSTTCHLLKSIDGVLDCHPDAPIQIS